VGRIRPHSPICGGILAFSQGLQSACGAAPPSRSESGSIDIDIKLDRDPWLVTSEVHCESALSMRICVNNFMSCEHSIEFRLHSN
jgi:hypothetical protein